MAALLLALGLVLAPAGLHAQLVSDGGTAVVNATTTNLTGNLVVGTNGSFTTLIITNAGAVATRLKLF